MPDLKKIADDADVIISGYAITKCAEGLQVFNLNNAVGAAVFQKDGTLVETNMDDIELEIARDYMLSGLKYMGE
jgi:ABC-type uncharacterized transport system permease subunit